MYLSLSTLASVIPHFLPFTLTTTTSTLTLKPSGTLDPRET